MQNLTVDEDLLEDDGKGGQRARRKESFFLWFDQVGPQGEVLSVDEISEIIHDQIWPNPLALYYGEAVCAHCLCFCVRVLALAGCVPPCVFNLSPFLSKGVSSCSVKKNFSTRDTISELYQTDCVNVTSPVHCECHTCYRGRWKGSRTLEQGMVGQVCL